jgi:hypothetical protein
MRKFTVGGYNRNNKGSYAVQVMLESPVGRDSITHESYLGAIILYPAETGKKTLTGE